MHPFLRAIGFSNINSREDLDKIIGIIMNEPDKKKRALLSSNNKYTEMSREFAHRLGIVIRGEYDALGFFHLEHYFPYCASTLVTADEDITINRRVDTHAYTGMCDDLRLGISLIFYLQNAVDYVLLQSSDNTPHKARVALSGLSLQGTVLLGIERGELGQKRRKYENHLRSQLIAQAKSGNQDAIDSLTVDEIDLCSQINRRIKTEDLYSLVDSSFIPYGSESDNYSILGTIVNWSQLTNQYSQETVYQLLINCNDILITVCINKTDLTGEPMIGRRFKGVIWMQGHVDFQKVDS